MLHIGTRNRNLTDTPDKTLDASNVELLGRVSKTLRSSKTAQQSQRLLNTVVNSQLSKTVIRKRQHPRTELAENLLLRNALGRTLCRRHDHTIARTHTTCQCGSAADTHARHATFEPLYFVRHVQYARKPPPRLSPRPQERPPRA